MIRRIGLRLIGASFLGVTGLKGRHRSLGRRLALAGAFLVPLMMNASEGRRSGPTAGNGHEESEGQRFKVHPSGQQG